MMRAILALLFWPILLCDAGTKPAPVDLVTFSAGGRTVFDAIVSLTNLHPEQGSIGDILSSDNMDVVPAFPVTNWSVERRANYVVSRTPGVWLIHNPGAAQSRYLITKMIGKPSRLRSVANHTWSNLSSACICVHLRLSFLPDHGRPEKSFLSRSQFVNSCARPARERPLPHSAAEIA